MLRRLLTTSLIVATAVPPCALSAAEYAPTRSNSTEQRALDLRAPEIGKIFSLAEINAVLSHAVVDPSLEYVEVEALRLPDLPMQDSFPPAEQIARTATWLFVPSATFAAVEREAPDATFPQRSPPYLQASYEAGVPRSGAP